jgi:dolichol-phosphate mannosyltransferase
MHCSIVIPVLNEQANISPLINEIDRAIQNKAAFEVIFVDDHSSDHTYAEITRLQSRFPWLRVTQLPRQSGQSSALYHGVKHARYPMIVTLDGDGQNDPADIARLLEVYVQTVGKEPVKPVFCLVNGHRVQRKDSGWRRFSSYVANSVRRFLLGDATPDSGCGIKAFSRDCFLALPRFDHMHRFLPALARQSGALVISVPVNHRGRMSGKSHYNTMGRLSVGLVDLVGVFWLGRRSIEPNLSTGDANDS